MKESVDKFQVGVLGLRAFLDNADRENLLTGMLLRAERFATLTPAEQGLIRNIARFATAKRQFIYAASIVGMYGLLERYVDSVLEGYIAKLSAIITQYNDLPQAIRANHLGNSVELLKLINEDKYYGEATINDIIANLNACLSPTGTFRINGSAFVLHKGNITFDKIKAFLSSLGIDAAPRKLIHMSSLAEFIIQGDIWPDLTSASEEQISALLSQIDDLVSRRNEISHGKIDEIESIDVLRSRSYLLEAFCHGFYERLQHELLAFEVKSAAAQHLGKPIAVFGDRVVCFGSDNCHVSVGDRIVAETGDPLVPYRWSAIKKIEVENVSKEELLVTSATNFGVEACFKVKRNYNYFVLARE